MPVRGIEDLRASFKRRRESARILFDQSLVARHREVAQRHLEALRDSDLVDDEPIAVDAFTIAPNELAELERQIAAAEVEFVFESIGRGRWLQLVAQHPPSAEDRRDGWGYDRASFIPAALVASCVSHELTLDDAFWLCEELDVGEFNRLWAACHTANAGEALRPKSEAAAVIRRLSSASWGTAAREASPGASS